MSARVRLECRLAERRQDAERRYYCKNKLNEFINRRHPARPSAIVRLILTFHIKHSHTRRDRYHKVQIVIKTHVRTQTLREYKMNKNNGIGELK